MRRRWTPMAGRARSHTLPGCRPPEDYRDPLARNSGPRSQVPRPRAGSALARRALPPPQGEVLGRVDRRSLRRGRPPDIRCGLAGGPEEPMGKRLTLILGGARSGKSAYAQKLAAEQGPSVLFVATAEPLDEEMAARIARHRAETPGHWRTLEVPRRVGPAIAAQAGA